MPGVRVDNNEPAAMYAAAHKAIERARAGHGPTLIEAMTFRFYGHQMSDSNEYMKPGELERERAADPVLRMRDWLIENDVLSVEAIETIEAQAKSEVEDAYQFADTSPVPELSQGLTDVYEEAQA